MQAVIASLHTDEQRDLPQIAALYGDAEGRLLERRLEELGPGG